MSFHCEVDVPKLLNVVFATVDARVADTRFRAGIGLGIGIPRGRGGMYAGTSTFEG
jgi:hypothetical protein